MDQHCFNREELSNFLEIVFGLDIASENIHIPLLMEEWESWNLEFTCLATLLSQVLENKQKQSVDVHKILQEIYTLSEHRGLFSVEEIDTKFIEYMFRYVRREDLSIEDHLIEIRRDLGEYRY
jgi:hypothetical protein